MCTCQTVPGSYVCGRCHLDHASVRCLILALLAYNYTCAVPAAITGKLALLTRALCWSLNVQICWGLTSTASDDLQCSLMLGGCL